MTAVDRVLDQIAGLQVQDRPRPEPDRLRFLFAVTIVLAVGGGAFYYWHHASKGEAERPLAPLPASHVKSEFEGVYSQLGIQPLPSNVERQQQVQSRLAQLSREACYTDAIVGLGRALLAVGYPREAATSLRHFVGRCGSAAEVLPLAVYSFSANQRLFRRSRSGK